jgi:pimeloyl-ACP methyl ester carboxylesterase
VTAKWRRRAKIAGGFALAYGATFLFVNVADKLLLWPQRGPEPSYGAQRWVVPDGKRTLEIWRAESHPGERARAIVLRFPGNSDRVERWLANEAKAYGDVAVELWGVNYPGFGGSEGPASLSGVAEAADRAADAAFQVAAGRPVFAFGASMGTTAALHIAATHDIAGVYAQNAPALREVVRKEHWWWNLGLLAWPVSLQIPAALDSVANASLSRAPAAFVTSEKDTLVPPYIQRLVIDAYAGPKQLHTIPGGGHDATTTPEIRAAVTKWFEERLRAIETK